MITFDDGYQNNYDLAWPILKELGLPATIFVCTGMMDTQDTVWFCRLHDALAHSPAPALTWHGHTYVLNSAQARESTSLDLQAQLKKMPHHTLIAEVQQLIIDLGDDPQRPIAPGSPYRMLNQASLQALAESDLIELGAHTNGHAILTRLTPEERCAEIESSVRSLEARTGRPCRLFSYPNGQAEDYDTLSMQTLARLGIEAAVTTQDGANEAATPVLELRRYLIGARSTLPLFKFQVHHSQNEVKRLIRWA